MTNLDELANETEAEVLKLVEVDEAEWRIRLGKSLSYYRRMIDKHLELLYNVDILRKQGYHIVFYRDDTTHSLTYEAERRRLGFEGSQEPRE